MRNRMWILVVVVVALVALAACGATDAPPTEAPVVEAPTEASAAEAPEAKTLKIGTLVSLEFPLGVDMQKELDALVPVLNEQGGINVLAVQVQVQPASRQRETRLEGKDSLVDEPGRKPGSPIKLVDFGQTPLANGPRAVRFPIDATIMKNDVPSVFAEPHVHFSPLEFVLDAVFQRRSGILGGLMKRSAVRHDLKRARRDDRLEELECGHGQRRQGADKQTQWTG